MFHRLSMLILEEVIRVDEPDSLKRRGWMEFLNNFVDYNICSWSKLAESIGRLGRTLRNWIASSSQLHSRSRYWSLSANQSDECVGHHVINRCPRVNPMNAFNITWLRRFPPAKLLMTQSYWPLLPANQSTAYNPHVIGRLMPNNKAMEHTTQRNWSKLF